MKYTIRKYDNQYVIGTGLKRRLKWQWLAIVFWLLLLLATLGVGALASFVSMKGLIALPFVLLIFGILIGTRRYFDEDFKFLPYKVDRWETAYRVIYNPAVDTVELLKQALSYDNIKNVVDPDELVEATVATLKLYDAKKLRSDDVRDYNESLQELIGQCDLAKNRQLLGAWDSHDTVLKSALHVAKTVNGEMKGLK
jgi:hypothetical protein